MQVNNYQRDGYMADAKDYEDAPNYHPNSFDDIKPDASYKISEEELDSNQSFILIEMKMMTTITHNLGFSTPKAMNPEDRTNLVNNIIGHMSKIDDSKEEIINRQFCHFFQSKCRTGNKR